ncbi:MAG: ChaN family lipoprotein [Planctomycetes bacterium]|nr:ChaN family lipoprotein [Planctomycetota bacterium]
MGIKEELIEIQKRLVKRIKQELYAEYCQSNPQIEPYYDDYKKLTDSYERPAAKAELISVIAESDIVYIGDYHTLRQAKKTMIRIMESLTANQSDRRIIIGLEAFQSKYQPAVDRYINREIDETELLALVDYDKTWGFNWHNYQMVLDYTRNHSIKVVALNNDTEPGGRPPSLRLRRAGRLPITNLAKRDMAAADIIATTIKQYPDSLMLVLFGDLHISENHLPRVVEERLAKENLLRRRLIICQNSERIYWKLAAEGLEQSVDLVKIKDRVYGVVNSTPIMVFQSCLNFQNQEKEIAHCPVHQGWCEDADIPLTEEIAELVKAICNFLNLEPPPADKFSVCTAHDFEALERLKQKAQTREEAQLIEADLAQTESYFVSESNTICLTNLSLNHAAEEAAHFINHHYVQAAIDKIPHGQRPKIPPGPAAKFYQRVIREALGFFGSRIINHKRLCDKERDFEETLIHYGRKKVLTINQREKREIARMVLEHKKRERDYLDRPTDDSIIRWKPYRKIYHLPINLWVGLSQALGYLLGDKLYEGLTQGVITKSELRELFIKPFIAENEPVEGYLYLIKRTQDVTELYSGKQEHL